ncbi:YafY family protein [Desulfocicer niacini]
MTARELGEAFGISRQIAQKVITNYREKYPHQMVYKSKQKRHVAIDSFEPLHVSKDPLKFLDFLRGDTLIGYYREERTWSDFEINDVTRLLHPKLDFPAIKILLEGLHRKQTVSIEYRKKDWESDGWTSRIISPHNLVYADNRYHVRGFCHLKYKFLDFVLSRIVFAENVHEDWIPPDDDKEWNQYVKLAFKANTDLPQGIQDAIVQNYKIIESGVRIINCRKALAFYVERDLLKTDAKYGCPLWLKC